MARKESAANAIAGLLFFGLIGLGVALFVGIVLVGIALVSR